MKYLLQKRSGPDRGYHEVLARDDDLELLKRTFKTLTILVHPGQSLCIVEASSGEVLRWYSRDP